jgi:hypothetical protein
MVATSISATFMAYDRHNAVRETFQASISNQRSATHGTAVFTYLVFSMYVVSNVSQYVPTYYRVYYSQFVLVSSGLIPNLGKHFLRITDIWTVFHSFSIYHNQYQIVFNGLK